MKPTTQQPFNPAMASRVTEQGASGSGQTAADKAGGAIRAAREKFEDRGAEMMNQAKRKAGRVYNQANRGLNEQYERVIDYSREHPGKATLIAFGVGVGVGLLVAGSFNTRSRRSRMVEPVMNALSTLAYNLVR
jgi:ElaB/YqjD/DUF883 family membrane-anchored ribosome-binding protein